MECDHYCSKCHCHFAEIDPHSICKNCRQPNPQMFYCNDEQCQACIEIKSCKPMEDILHKYELKKMAKKFALSSKSHSKKHNDFSNDDKRSDYHSKQANQSFVRPSTHYSPGTSFSRNEITPSHFYDERYSSLENRLFDKLFSRLSEANLVEQPPSKAKVEMDGTRTSNSTKLIQEIQSIFNIQTKIDSPTFIHAEKEYAKSLIAFFKHLNSDLFTNSEILDREDSGDAIVRLSSKASDILRTSTLLSSPSYATKLAEVVPDCDGDVWPKDLKISSVLNFDSEKIRLKAHPKVRQMQAFLFGNLEPSLPKKILSPSFSLPSIPLQLQQDFTFAREQLHRLLLLFSIIDNFISFKNADLDVVTKTFLLILQSQVELLMINQANYFGLLIQEMRRVLLKNAVCKVPGGILKLITGPIHATQFFGPYVFEIQRKVERSGTSYCIQHKLKKASVEAHKLPCEYFSSGKNPTLCLEALNKFFVANHSKDYDKALILKALIPKSLLCEIEKFITSKSKISFEELSNLFMRYGSSSSDFLDFRFSFSRRVQNGGESLKEFADALDNLVPFCSYDQLEKEMLRDQFVFGICDEQLRKFLLQKPLWSFEDCLSWATSHVDSSESFLDENFAGKSKKRKSNADIKSRVKKLKDFSYHESLNIFCEEKNKHINVSSLDLWNQIFKLDDSYSYQVVCPWTGRLLRE